MKHHPAVEHIFNTLHVELDKLLEVRSELPKKQQVVRPHKRAETRIIQPDGMVTVLKPGVWR